MTEQKEPELFEAGYYDSSLKQHQFFTPIRNNNNGSASGLGRDAGGASESSSAAPPAEPATERYCLLSARVLDLDVRLRELQKTVDDLQVVNFSNRGMHRDNSHSLRSIGERIGALQERLSLEPNSNSNTNNNTATTIASNSNTCDSSGLPNLASTGSVLSPRAAVSASPEDVVEAFCLGLEQRLTKRIEALAEELETRLPLVLQPVGEDAEDGKKSSSAAADQASSSTGPPCMNMAALDSSHSLGSRSDTPSATLAPAAGLGELERGRDGRPGRGSDFREESGRRKEQREEEQHEEVTALAARIAKLEEALAEQRILLSTWDASRTQEPTLSRGISGEMLSQASNGGVGGAGGSIEKVKELCQYYSLSDENWEERLKDLEETVERVAIHQEPAVSPISSTPKQLEELKHSLEEDAMQKVKTLVEEKAEGLREALQHDILEDLRRSFDDKLRSEQERHSGLCEDLRRRLETDVSGLRKEVRSEGERQAAACEALSERLLQTVRDQGDDITARFQAELASLRASRAAAAAPKLSERLEGDYRVTQEQRRVAAGLKSLEDKVAQLERTSHPASPNCSEVSPSYSRGAVSEDNIAPAECRRLLQTLSSRIERLEDRMVDITAAAASEGGASPSKGLRAASADLGSDVVQEVQQLRRDVMVIRAGHQESRSMHSMLKDMQEQSTTQGRLLRELRQESKSRIDILQISVQDLERGQKKLSVIADQLAFERQTCAKIAATATPGGNERSNPASPVKNIAKEAVALALSPPPLPSTLSSGDDARKQQSPYQQRQEEEDQRPQRSGSTADGESESGDRERGSRAMVRMRSWSLTTPRCGFAASTLPSCFAPFVRSATPRKLPPRP